MTKKSKIDEDLYRILFNFEPTKAQKRIMQIIEAAIENYATIGVDATTYDTIAKTCKVSRPLIQHYFCSRMEIFEMAVKVIRANFQNMAIEAIKAEKTPSGMLRAYVDSTFDWLKKYPKHVQVWSLFYYYCGLDPKMKAVNTELVKVGRERIASMLAGGHQSGEFSGKNHARNAKQIQSLITGALVTAQTESLEIAQEKYRKDVYETCLQIANS